MPTLTFLAAGPPRADMVWHSQSAGAARHPPADLRLRAPPGEDPSRGAVACLHRIAVYPALRAIERIRTELQPLRRSRRLGHPRGAAGAGYGGLGAKHPGCLTRCRTGLVTSDGTHHLPDARRTVLRYIIGAVRVVCAPGAITPTRIGANLL